MLDGRYPVSPLLWAQPTPADAAVHLCFRARVGFHPHRRVSQITGATCRCAPSPPTPAGPEAARARCFTPGSRLHQLGEPGRLRLGVSRPNRVRLRYGSHLRRAESPAVRLLPPTAPPATCLTGHYTAASFHAARLTRFTGGSQGAKNAKAEIAHWGETNETRDRPRSAFSGSSLEGSEHRILGDLGNRQ